MLRLATAAAAAGVIAGIARCGGAAPDRGLLRHSGAWYRERPDAARTRVAAACRAQASAEARGGRAREQLRAIYAIRGRLSPPSAGARVVGRRMDGYTVRATSRPDGSFVLPVRFRDVADNTFTITVTAPPAAVHKLLFTAICLDCPAGMPSAS